MRRWLLLLGGPLIWTAHFGLIYVISSISVQATGETTLLARTLIVTAGAIAIAACLGVLILARRMSSPSALEQFWKNVSSFGAVLAAIAIAWQSLPALAPI